MKYFQTTMLKIFFILMLLYLGFIYTSCSTKPGFADNNYPGILASDGKVLFYFNLEKDRLLLNQFLSSYSKEDLSGLIDRTDRLSISIDGFGINSDFNIIAEGQYPRIFTNFAIGRGDSWIKHKSKYTFWENEIEGLYASIPSNSVALISNTDISSNLKYLETGTRNYIPDIIKLEFEQSAVTVYSHLPGIGIYKSLNIPSEKMFIQDMYFLVKKDADFYSITGVLDFINKQDAKIFSTALKLGLLMKLKETGKSSIMKIVHDGRIDAVDNKIIFDSILLDSNEMVELISGAGVSK